MCEGRQNPSDDIAAVIEQTRDQIMSIINTVRDSMVEQMVPEDVPGTEPTVFDIVESQARNWQPTVQNIREGLRSERPGLCPVAPVARLIDFDDCPEEIPSHPVHEFDKIPEEEVRRFQETFAVDESKYDEPLQAERKPPAPPNWCMEPKCIHCVDDPIYYLPRSAIIRTQRPPVYYGPHLPEYYGEQRPPPDEQEPEPQGAAACTPPPPPQEPQYPDMPDFEAEYPAYSKRKHGTRQQYEQIKKIELDFRRANWIRKHKKAPRIATKKASCLPKNRVSLLPPNMQRKAAAAQSTAGTSGAAQQPPGNQGQGGARPKTKLSAPGTSGLKCRKPTTGTSRQQGAPGTSRGTGVPAGRGTGLRRPATGDNCREERRPMTGP
ncbi:uncharacterized protein LOC124361842 [Homalodisca vitripennis]|uniref:uncharacterized protein LOC124361842 n=1 Tax=Homalodisca vitripennis TaxID=197043 RepID=UPI001EEA9059|nr:uncharacterized protein LOC124361842 [Homalodisca vitripennis]